MFFNFRSQQDFDQSLELEELLARSEKVKEVEFSTEDSVERYFTREKVRSMIKFITEEPDSDASKERGHTIPFHCDMIFQYNKAAINIQFFTVEEDAENSGKSANTAGKRNSPQQMIDVFMTPQSDDNSSSDGSMSPEDNNFSLKTSNIRDSTGQDNKITLSPPVSTFTPDEEDDEVQLDEINSPANAVDLDDDTPELLDIKDLEQEKSAKTPEQSNEAIIQPEPTETSQTDDASQAQPKIKADEENQADLDKVPTELKIEENKEAISESIEQHSSLLKEEVKEQKLKEEEQTEDIQDKKDAKAESGETVEVFSDTQLQEQTQKEEQTTVQNGGEEQINKQSPVALEEHYLEESKDVDRFKISFDDDDEDGSTILEDKQDEITAEKPVVNESQSEMNNSNKYALFEEFCTFLNVEKDETGQTKMLNPVLLGYWCNLFRSLVQTHPQYVFIYVYEHQELLEKMLDHLYSPQMSDIFVRLLNFNKSVFNDIQPLSSRDESEKDASTTAAVSSSFSENEAQEIRQCTVFGIIQRIGDGYSFDQQKSALMCLIELPNEAPILSIMVRPSSLEQIKESLKIEDEIVKANCFKFLNNILCRIFDAQESNDWSSASSGMFNSENQDKKSEEQELLELKNSAKKELFQFMSTIVQLVISFELQIENGTPSSEKELKFTEIIGSKTRIIPRLGLMRLNALELLEKLQKCYGLRMLEVLKDSDVYTSLMKMYALYPFNDMAQRYVTSIISYSLDHKLAKQMNEQTNAPKGRPSRILDLEPINMSDTEQTNETEASQSETIENEQTRQDALLVYILFSTPLMDLIMEMCQQRERLEYEKTTNKTEMGYVAHLTCIGQLLIQIGQQNEVIREQLDESPEWSKFETEYLKPRIEKRTGKLCRGKQFEKQKESRFLSMFDDEDDDDDGDQPVNMFSRDDDYGGGFEDQRTNQDEMDRLLQPILDFDDNDEEGDSVENNNLLKPTLDSKLNDPKDEKTGNENNDGEEQYSMDKYFSNGAGDIDRGHKLTQAVYSKRQQLKSNTRRYGNSDDDEEEIDLDNDDEDNFVDQDRYTSQPKQKDSESQKQVAATAVNDKQFSLEELDGWISQVNDILPPVDDENKESAVAKTQDGENTDIKPSSTEQDSSEATRTDNDDKLMFGKKVDAEDDQDEEDEDEDDGLGLDFMMQVQKEKTALRTSQLQELQEQEQQKQMKQQETATTMSSSQLLVEEVKTPTKTPDEYFDNNYWRKPVESEDYSIDNLLADYD